MATDTPDKPLYLSPLLPWHWAAAAWQQWFNLAAAMVPGLPSREKAEEQQAFDTLMLRQALTPQPLQRALEAITTGGAEAREGPVASARTASENAPARRRRKPRAPGAASRSRASSKPRAQRTGR